MKLFRFIFHCYFFVVMGFSSSWAFIAPFPYKKISLQYALNFEIYQNKMAYLLYFKKIPGSSGAQCILIGDINTKLDGCSTVFKFKNQISTFGAFSTTHVGFLKELNSLDKLKAFGPKYLLEENEKKNVMDLGSNLDINLYLKSPVELFLSYHFGDLFFGKSKMIQRLSTPILYINDFNEKHPLARAEWLKVFGVLCGKFKESENRFREIESEYWRISALAKNISLNNMNIERPEVIYGQVVGNNFSVVTNKDFYFYIFKDLNVKLVNSNDSLDLFSQMRYLNFESIYHYLIKATYWFNPSPYSFSKDSIKNKKFNKLESVKQKNLYTISFRQDDSYWRNISSRPDKILFDLYQILFLSKNNDPSSFFVRFK